MSKTTTLESTTVEFTRLTDLPPLTTLFSQPEWCQSLFSESPVETSGTTTIWRTNSDDYNFPSCQPSGWDQYGFTFSPGICPQVWTYFSMTKTVRSQAYCCAPGYSMQYSEGSPSCISQDGISTDIYYEHKPWLVAWDKTDFTSLPYTLPDLDVLDSVASWTAPEIASSSGSSLNTASDDNGGSSSRAVPLLTVILPIALFLLICAGGCCWQARYIRKRKRLVAQQEIDLREIAQRRVANKNGTDNGQGQGNSNVVTPPPVHRYA